jgi:tetratricopeptide (TPR) repeat protein
VTIHDMLCQAIAAHQAGELNEAVRLYGVVLDDQPSNAVANYNLGVLSLEVQNLGSAVILFRNAIESNPKEKQYWRSYIDALTKDGQVEKAEEVKEEAEWYLSREESDVLELEKAPFSPIE